MAKKTTKTVKLPESKAEEWDEYAEENEAVDSISHLIRLSVEREMQGKYNQPEASSGNSGGAQSGEVLTALRKVQTGVSDIEDRLRALESVERAEEKYSLKKAVWELLPEEPQQIIDDEVPPVYGDDDDDGLEAIGLITAQQISQKLGADVTDVQDALDELVESTGQVKCSDTNFDGNYYWKKGA